MDTQLRTEKQGRFRALRHFLVSSWSGTLLPAIFLVSLLAFALLDTLMSVLTHNLWQASGYYLSVLKYGFFLLLTGHWVLSIFFLFLDRRYMRGLLRLISMPVIFLIGGIVAFIALFFPSTISHWPIDTVFSDNRKQFYILAYEPVPTDTCYRVFSTRHTLMNPLWKVEFGGDILDYSEDGSLTKDPHVILSEDEEMLIISRGGHFTDAILIDSGQPLTHLVPWSDENRENKWAQRTEIIKQLLKKHSPKKPAQMPLTYSQIRVLLQEYGTKLANDLTQRFIADEWIVSCELHEVDWNDVKAHAYFTFRLSRDNEKHVFSRSMTFVEDHGEMIVVEQDNGLSWSDENEKMLCVKVRDILNEIAGSGTYVK
jgi:hypothetical protein